MKTRTGEARGLAAGEGIQAMRMETERLILRPWEEADAEECFRYASDPRVGSAAGWPIHTDAEHSRRIIREVLSAPETWAMVLKETGLPVGSIGLLFGASSAMELEEDECELGYWIGVPLWGRGLTPEAVRELLRHAFADLGVRAVWCGYYDGNGKSARVQEKCGFRYQRTVEDMEVPQLHERRRCHVTRITREEWLSESRVPGEPETGDPPGSGGRDG